MAETTTEQEITVRRHDGTCVSRMTARVVAVGWSVWTGITALLVGHFGLHSWGKGVGFAWAFTVMVLIQDWLDV